MLITEIHISAFTAILRLINQTLPIDKSRNAEIIKQANLFILCCRCIYLNVRHPQFVCHRKI